MSNNRLVNLSCLGLALLSSILFWGKVMRPQVSRGLDLQLTSDQPNEPPAETRLQLFQNSVPAQGRPTGRMRGGSSR